MTQNLHDAALDALLCDVPSTKCQLARRLHADCIAGTITAQATHAPRVIEQPGRPDLPELVHPRDVPRRRLNSDQGKAAFVHAIAHIEFNAINLALDAAYRFRDLPGNYYQDWLLVAAEESKHFELLRARLQSLGFDYGDFTAHNGLWEMAAKTASNLVARMALVPRVLEARGLDVTPGMIQKLTRLGDSKTVEILEIILADEVGHVAIGTRWFPWSCAEQGLEPDSTFRGFLDEYGVGQFKLPLNEEARLAAGFSAEELARLTN